MFVQACFFSPTEIKIKVSIPEMYVNKLYMMKSLSTMCKRLEDFFFICLIFYCAVFIHTV